MAWHVDKAEFSAVRQYRVGKAEIDGQSAPLLLGQPVGIDPGQGAHQRGLAMVDMPRGRQDHARKAESWAMNSVSSSRQRRSSTTRPLSMRPITGTGKRRRRRASFSGADPERSSGVSASPALGNSDTGNAPLPIWLLVSIRDTVARPSRAFASTGSIRRANAWISARDRVSRRKAGNRSAN